MRIITGHSRFGEMDGQVKTTAQQRSREKSSSDSERSALLGSSATVASCNKTSGQGSPIDSWESGLVPHRQGSKRLNHSTRYYSVFEDPSD